MKEFTLVSSLTSVMIAKSSLLVHLIWSSTEKSIKKR